MRETKLEAFIYLFLFILLCGFFKLQIIEGDYFRSMSENNRIRTIPTLSVRGRIYDRNGFALAENKPILNFLIIPEDFDLNNTGKIAEMIYEDPDFLREKIEQALTHAHKAKPLLIKRDIGMAAVFRLEEISTLIGGLLIEKNSLRYYPEEDLASHVVGYIGRINQREYSANKHKGWLINDYVGRIGIEKTFNDDLMGAPGGRQVEVNAKGQQIRILSEKDPLIGKDIALTLDIRFQERVMNIIDESQNAAVCVMDVRSGDVLSLISVPTFNPNIFLDSQRTKERMATLVDKRFPVINRTISSLYSPGSVFKLLIALAALQEGEVTPHTTFICRGKYQMNERSRAFKCWKKEGHGKMNLESAIEQSCNIYFYRTGLRLGNRKIAKYARLFGFGSKIELGLPFGKQGLVPDAIWKLKKFRERWYPGETLNYSIGQGFLQVTPLQIAKMIAAIANGGTLVEPNIIKGIHLPKSQLPIDKVHLETIRRNMLRAIESKLGTAQLAKPSFFRMAGKTGTAQTFGEPHSWYGGFFPYNNPQIAIVVLVEHGGPGGGTAAVYAGAIADEWLLYQKKKSRPQPEEIR